MLDEKAQYLVLMFVDIPSAVTVREAEGEAAAREIVRECLGILGTVREKHGGDLIRTVGSSLLCSFKAADAAVEAACEMQTAIVGGRVAASLRIGLHAGNVVVCKSSCSGEVVTTAARMVTLAKPHQIVATDAIFEALSPSARDLLAPLAEGGALESRLRVKLYQIAWRQEPDQAAAATPVPFTVDALPSPSRGSVPPAPSPRRRVPQMALDFTDTVREVDLSPFKGRRDGGDGASAKGPSSAPAEAPAPEPVPERAKETSAPEPAVPSKPGQAAARDADAAAGVALCMICDGNVITVNAEKPLVLIGRDSRNDVVVRNEMVSRRHAEIELREGQFYLTDYSWNGTFVYDEAGAETHLRNSQMRLSSSGAFCPGCPESDEGMQAILFWTA